MSPDLSAALRAVAGGVELSVFCQPKAARSALIGMHGGALKAKVKAPPVDGRANQELLDLLAAALAVPPGRLTLVSGEQSRNKRVRVDGAGLATVLAAILAALEPRPGMPSGGRSEGPKTPPDHLDGNGT
jgi:uncharacterized protein